MFKPKSLFLLMASLLALSGCGDTTEGETVRLQVWGPAKEGEKEVYEYLAGKFSEAHPEIHLKWVLVMWVKMMRPHGLGDIHTAADVFMFADDNYQPRSKRRPQCLPKLMQHCQRPRSRKMR
jgi:hypothetical protein